MRTSMAEAAQKAEAEARGRMGAVAPRRVVADIAEVAVAATRGIQTNYRVDCVIGVGAAVAAHDDLAWV